MRFKPLIQLTAVALLTLGAAQASEDPAPKVDSGLGELPHYRDWSQHPALARFGSTAVATHRVAGEKIDSGLGALPHYREWKNHSDLAHMVVEPDGATRQTAAARLP